MSRRVGMRRRTLLVRSRSPAARATSVGSVPDHGGGGAERDWLSELAQSTAAGQPPPVRDPRPSPRPNPRPSATITATSPLTTELAMMRAELVQLRTSVEAQSQPSAGVLAASALVELQAEVARLRDEVASFRLQLTAVAQHVDRVRETAAARNAATPADVAAVASELAQLRALLFG